MADETRWSLIRSAGEGNEAARAEFTRRYLPAVKAYLRARWGGRLPFEVLEDAAQEVFVECLKEGGVLERARREGHGEFRALLYGVTRNMALREESRRARQKDSPSDKTFYGDDHEALEASHSQLFDRAWAQALVREAWELQEQRARESGAESARRAELLRLRFQEELPIRDIARQWGADPVVLHREHEKAVREFERALRDVVAAQTPGSPEGVGRICREILSLLE
jgi:RNA polymerase sigma-70 factor (ECF subfamily)